MYLFQRIEEIVMNYHDARGAVAEFVLEEREKIPNYTIDEVASLSYTSKATVVRFAKTLGYDGWRKFVKDFVSELNYEKHHQGDVDANYPFSEHDSMRNIVSNIRILQMESVQDTADLLDLDMLKIAVDRLEKARHVVIFTKSPNAYVAELFRRKLVTIGKQAEVVNAGEMGITSHTLDPVDCAMIISYSGNNPSEEPMCYIEGLKRKKIPMIGITSGGDNYIRKEIDCILTMSSKERLYTKIANYATEESLQYILNVIFSCYFARDYKANKATKIAHSKPLEVNRNAVLMNMKDD